MLCVVLCARISYEAVRFRLHNADKFKDSFFTTAKLIQAITAGRNVLNPKVTLSVLSISLFSLFFFAADLPFLRDVILWWWRCV